MGIEFISIWRYTIALLSVTERCLEVELRNGKLGLNIDWRTIEGCINGNPL